jgi:hypothetical protein
MTCVVPQSGAACSCDVARRVGSLMCFVLSIAVLLYLLRLPDLFCRSSLAFEVIRTAHSPIGVVLTPRTAQPVPERCSFISLVKLRARSRQASLAVLSFLYFSILTS